MLLHYYGCFQCQLATNQNNLDREYHLKNCPDCLDWWGNSYPDYGRHLLIASQIKKGYFRRKFVLLFACLAFLCYRVDYLTVAAAVAGFLAVKQTSISELSASWGPVALQDLLGSWCWSRPTDEPHLVCWVATSHLSHSEKDIYFETTPTIEASSF